MIQVVTQMSTPFAFCVIGLFALVAALYAIRAINRNTERDFEVTMQRERVRTLELEDQSRKRKMET